MADARRPRPDCRHRPRTKSLVFSTKPTKTRCSEGSEPMSIGSLLGIRTHHPDHTFSKSYAMTGLRLGYIAIHDPAIRDRAKKVPALHRQQRRVGGAAWRHRRAQKDRRTASRDSAPNCAPAGICSTPASRRWKTDRSPGKPPAGAFYGFLSGRSRRGRTGPRRPFTVVADDRISDQTGTNRFACPAPTSAATAKATCVSASPAAIDVEPGARSDR